MFKLFEGKDHSSKYAKARPSTPESVLKRTLAFMEQLYPRNGERYSKMADVGCGSGQSTAIFAQYFENIIGLDTSENQINFAKKNNSFSNIEYKVGNGENLPFQDGTLDLVASGQAVHWMDFDRFFAECRRVLKPEGCLLLHGYKLPRVTLLETEENRETEIERITGETNAKCRFHPRIKHVDEGYTEIFGLLKSENKIHEDGILKIERKWTLADLGDYYHSWSGYVSYMANKTKELQLKYGSENVDSEILDKHDIVRICLDEMKKVWNLQTKKDSDINLHVTFDVFMVISGRPDV